MNKTLLIVRREYLQRVRKKSFILLTLSMPLLMAALVGVPLWLASIGGERLTVAIVDQTSRYAPLFDDTDAFHFVRYAQPVDSLRAGAAGQVDAVLSITGDLLADPSAAILYAEKQIPPALAEQVNRTLKEQIERDKIASFNIPDLERIIAESRITFAVRTVKWGEDGAESQSSTEAASAIGILCTFLIYMFIMSYGAMVMQSVSEEKTNRIAEIMVSSVRPFELMAGKIVGIGFVGLTQLGIWFMLAAGGLTVLPTFGAQMAGNDIGEIIAPLQSFNFGEIALFFILFFIGGYLIYAALFAAIGSAINSPEDSQQFMMPVTMLLVFALYAGIYGASNPDGPLAFWTSIFPLTSPIVMLMRIPFDVVWWEKWLSIALLYGTTAAIVWLSGKIYRVGILMYGKKPTLKEMIRWISYK